MVRNSGGSNRQGVIVVEFELTDQAYPFVRLSVEENCRVVLQKMLQRGAGKYAEYFSIFDADPDRVLSLAEESDLVKPELISRYDNGGLFEFIVAGFCPARELAEQGAIPREVVSEDGIGKISAEIPPVVDPSSVIEGFLEYHPTAELRGKESKDRLTPLFTRNEFQKSVNERFTERQQEVMETAFENGAVFNHLKGAGSPVLRLS